jgi:hypothetical protein
MPTIAFLSRQNTENILNLCGEVYYINSHICRWDLQPVFATLRSRYGHCCLGYINDSIYIEDTVKLSEEDTLDATQLITRLGFVVTSE